MSVSKTAGGANKCKPCDDGSAGSTLGNVGSPGGGAGSGAINCPGYSGGSGGIGGSIAKNFACPGMDDDCRDSLAWQINSRLCEMLGGGWFGADICYECGQLNVTINPECDSNGNFKGTIFIEPVTVRNNCTEVSC